MTLPFTKCAGYLDLPALCSKFITAITMGKLKTPPLNTFGCLYITFYGAVKKPLTTKVKSNVYLYLVRHGQASFSADNYDTLSTKGQQQATLLG